MFPGQPPSDSGYPLGGSAGTFFGKGGAASHAAAISEECTMRTGAGEFLKLIIHY